MSLKWTVAYNIGYQEAFLTRCNYNVFSQWCSWNQCKRWYDAITDGSVLLPEKQGIIASTTNTLGCLFQIRPRLQSNLCSKWTVADTLRPSVGELEPLIDDCSGAAYKRGPSHFVQACEANSIHFVLLFMRLRQSGSQTICAADETHCECELKSGVKRQSFTSFPRRTTDLTTDRGFDVHTFMLQ